MASELTYNSLLTDVPIYCEKTTDAQLATQLPRLIMLAENRIAVDFKTLGVNLLVTGALPVTNPVIPKPSYWRDTVSFLVTWTDGSQYTIYPRSYTFCRAFWPTPANTGKPRFYADYGSDHFLIVPTPPSALPLELSYHARLDPLDASHQTSWLTVNAPQLLFYAVMVEAQLMLKNDDKLVTWAKMYADALDGLNKENSGRKVDASVVPVG